MAQYLLGNAVNYRGTSLRPGKLIDDRQYDITKLRGAGALLYASSAVALAQAALIRIASLQGHDIASPDSATVDQIGLVVTAAGGGGGGGGSGSGFGVPLAVTQSGTLPGPGAYAPQGAITVLMPVAPKNGDVVSAVDLSESWGVTNVNLQANTGQQLEDVAAPGTFRAANVNVVLAVTSGSYVWQWDQTNNRWKQLV